MPQTIEIDYAEILYEYRAYKACPDKIIETNGPLLHRMLYKYRVPKDGTVVVIMYDWYMVSRDRILTIFDETGKEFTLMEAEIEFVNVRDENSKEYREIEMKTQAYVIEGIDQLDEIGNYLGFVVNKDYWLPAEDVREILAIRNTSEADKSHVYRKYAIEETIKEEKEKFVHFLSTEEKPETLSPKEQWLRRRAYDIFNTKGNVDFNDKDCYCPVCGEKYVAYNSAEYDYPFISEEMWNRNECPLTKRLYSGKYKCLVCNTEFGLLNERKCVFELSRGAFFAGTLDYEIYEHADHMRFKGDCSNDFCHMPSYRFRFPKEEMAVFTRIMKRARRWKPEYSCIWEVYDGYGWDLKYDFQNLKIESSGYVSKPFGYRSVIEALQKAIEYLCKKYATGYSEKGIRDRINL